jgi:hypothetical protein
VDHINKVIQYTKLRFEGGLEDDDTKKIWKIDGIYLEYIISNTNEFTKYKKNIKDNKKLKAFLEKNLPKNIFDSIIKVHTKFKKNVKDNKTIKKTVPQELDKQDKKLACTLTEEHKGNSYWHKIIMQINRMEGMENKKADLEVIVNRESATIASYRDCGCPKCKNVLKDGNLKKVKTLVAEYKESFGDDRGWTQSDRSLMVKTCQQGWGAYTQESKDYCECIVIKCMKEWDSLEEMDRDITLEEKDMDEWAEACMLEITKR